MKRVIVTLIAACIFATPNLYAGSFVGRGFGGELPGSRITPAVAAELRTAAQEYLRHNTSLTSAIRTESDGFSAESPAGDWKLAVLNNPLIRAQLTDEQQSDVGTDYLKLADARRTRIEEKIKSVGEAWKQPADASMSGSERLAVDIPGPSSVEHKNPPTERQLQLTRHEPDSRTPFPTVPVIQTEETASFRKSPERLQLEQEINDSQDAAQKEAFLWMLKHPFRGAKALYTLWRRGDVSDDVSRAWQSLPGFTRYRNAYDRLEKLERTENFPAVKYYAEQLDRLGARLPPANTLKAYYPFAGVDFYWARIFKKTVFEDTSYGQKFTRNMWWAPEKYQWDSIRAIGKTLVQAEALSLEFQAAHIVGDANRTRQDNDFNKPDWTLIVKGGHSVINFFEQRFGGSPLQFGAIIVVSPADAEADLKEGMKRRGYELVHFESGKSFYAPFAMGLRDRYIFIKKS